jgi:hypothetical protein
MNDTSPRKLVKHAPKVSPPSSGRLFGLVVVALVSLVLVAVFLPHLRKAALLLGGGILLFLIRYALFKDSGPVGLPFFRRPGQRRAYEQRRAALTVKKNH